MSSHALRLAARLWGVQTGYTAVGGAHVEAPESSVRTLLEEISDRPARTEKDLEALIETARSIHAKKSLEPVNVLWCRGNATKGATEIQATVPREWLNEPLEYRIELETGDVREGQVKEPVVIRPIPGKGNRVRIRLPLPEGLPLGYHRLSLHRDPKTKASLFIAPLKAYRARARKKMWGGFLPLYAIRSERNWGIGDLDDMRALQDRLHEFGADFFGTLPLLATMSEGEDYDPSPYSPASRLFWNEIFLGVEGAKAPKKLRTGKAVDYAEVFRLKKEEFRRQAQEFAFSGSDYVRFLKDNPRAEAYAKFRAKGNPKEERYHLYVQYRMDASLAQINRDAVKGKTAGLYLDFPVGVNRGGFDSDQFQDSFILKASAGAPPDGLFPGGQNWGFAPLHPLNLRERGYDYFIESVRNHLRYAKVLRVDHFMGLHRIYVIPEGANPKSGTYIRYFSEEFYAILTIESHRAKVEIVGEDLGTVPESVVKAIEKHGFLHMWVLPFEAGNEPKRAIANAPEKSLACMNTHDMVPFAGYLKARDVTLFEKLNVIDALSAKKSRKERVASLKSWGSDLRASGDTLVAKILKMMAASPPEILLVNLEDLWGESEPQNIPGTWKEYPNWRRKIRADLDELLADKSTRRLLNEISRSRSGKVATNASSNRNEKSNANRADRARSR